MKKRTQKINENFLYEYTHTYQHSVSKTTTTKKENKTKKNFIKKHFTLKFSTPFLSFFLAYVRHVHSFGCSTSGFLFGNTVFVADIAAAAAEPFFCCFFPLLLHFP